MRRRSGTRLRPIPHDRDGRDDAPDATSRRGTKLLSVALLAIGMWVAPTVHDDPGMPAGVELHDVVLERPGSFVASGAGGAAAGAWFDFPPMDAGDTVLVGADWGAVDGVEVQVRTLDGGELSPWHDLVYEPEHGPDPDHLEPGQFASTVSDPLWLGESDQLLFRARGPSVPVTVSRVDLVGDTTFTPAELRPGAAIAATDQPAIVSRASWGADESIRRFTPREWNRANFAIIHHTAGNNDYAQDEVPGILQSIYAFHVLRRGWDDIAYNFLVDKYGTVWEGRAGGVTRPVIGGHASGFNGGSIGISAIGNFQATEPTPELVDGIRDVLAWKLDHHHLDPHGTTDEIAGGGSSNRFSPGERLTLPNIIGHRHTNSTSCPGDKLYEHVLGLHGDTAFADQVDAVGHPKAYGGPPLDREQPLHGLRPRWDVEFTRPVTWELTIVDEDGDEVRRGSGQNAEELDLAWDLRDHDGALVRPGEYRASLEAVGVDGEHITPITTEFDVTPPAERRSGDSRVDTAIELSRWAFPHSEDVVIASSLAFPDALVAGPLAGSVDAPILLVPPGHLPDAVVREIQRLHATKAYIVGGDNRVTQHAVDGLRHIGVTSITRLAGEDRWQTSAAVARFLINRDHPTEALLALGDHPQAERAFPDALSAGAFGATEGAPVLLVAGNVLPGAIDSVLGQRPWFDGVTVFGGPAAIEQKVVEQAAAAAGRFAGEGPAETRRIAGIDRYDTSVLAAEEVLRRRAERIEEDGPSPYAEPTGLEVVLASGTNWPDALGSSAAAAARGAVFALVHPDAVGASLPTADWLSARADDLAHALVSGGPGAVADRVVEEVGAIVASAGPTHEPEEPWPGEGAPRLLPVLDLGDDPEPSDEPTSQPDDEPTDSLLAAPDLIAVGMRREG